MPRFLLLLRTLLALCAIGLVACPTNPGGDDDDAGDDDDDDDDGASDPCDSVTDATANVNGATLTGNTSGPDDALTGSCGAGSPGAPETIFSIVAPEDGPMIASTANAGTDFDTIVYVMTTCGDDSTEVACDDDGGGQGGPSMAQWDATAGTTYYIVVDGYESSGNFELSIQQVICGDGVVAGDEQCDDSNTDSGDGCDSSCAWECTDDAYEPNSTLDEASDLSGETWPGTVDDLVLCPGDINDEFGVFVDFYAVTVGEGQYLDVEIQGGATLTTDCADQLMILSLLDADLNGLGGGDTSEGTCAQAAMEPEEAGTYYIAVFEGDQTFGPQDYTLSVDVGVSVCGDGNRTGIEECDDGNTTAGDGCSALCNEEDATCTIAGDATASVDGTNLTGDTSTAADEHAPEVHEPLGDAAVVHDDAGEHEERDGEQRERVGAAEHLLRGRDGAAVEVDDEQHAERARERDRDGDGRADREQQHEAAHEDRGDGAGVDHSAAASRSSSGVPTWPA